MFSEEEIESKIKFLLEEEYETKRFLPFKIWNDTYEVNNICYYKNKIKKFIDSYLFLNIQQTNELLKMRAEFVGTMIELLDIPFNENIFESEYQFTQSKFELIVREWYNHHKYYLEEEEIHEQIYYTMSDNDYLYFDESFNLTSKEKHRIIYHNHEIFRNKRIRRFQDYYEFDTEFRQQIILNSEFLQINKERYDS